MLVEREATHRAIALAELVDVPVLIVHVSGREAVEQIRWAQGHGAEGLSPRPARSTCC
jgi:dihydropyrimidinase